MVKMVKNPSAQSTFFWNLIGSIANSGATIFMLMVVTRENGTTDGGIFSIAYATAQVMQTIGLFGVRAYQATDLSERFRFIDYIILRIFSCIAMIISSFVYAFACGYSREKLWAVLLMCAYKMVDAVADVYEGMLQQKNRLNLAGQSLFYRTIFSTLVFTFAMIITKHLLLTMLVTVAASILAIVIFTLRPLAEFGRTTCSKNWENVGSLFLNCLPLFISLFFITYINNAPKLTIDKYMSYKIQTYYNILFMPAFVINMFSGFIFRPMLNSMADYFKKKEKTKFKKLVINLLLGITGLTALAILIGYFIGVPILSWLYGVDISTYKKEFIIVLLSGGFTAVVSLMYHAITVLRRQYILLVGYGSAALIITVLSPVLVQNAGIAGAVISYLLTISFLGFLLTGLFFCFIKKLSHKNQK